MFHAACRPSCSCPASRCRPHAVITPCRNRLPAQLWSARYRYSRCSVLSSVGSRFELSIADVMCYLNRAFLVLYAGTYCCNRGPRGSRRAGCSRGSSDVQRRLASGDFRFVRFTMAACLPVLAGWLTSVACVVLLISRDRCRLFICLYSQSTRRCGSRRASQPSASLSSPTSPSRCTRRPSTSTMRSRSMPTCAVSLSRFFAEAACAYPSTFGHARRSANHRFPLPLGSVLRPTCPADRVKAFPWKKNDCALFDLHCGEHH